MNDALIRAVRTSDLEAVHALNASAVPNVNDISIQILEGFMAKAAYFRVADSDGAVAAFLVGFAPGADYGSENYRWFSDHYAVFTYIDRIAVSLEHRGKGIALRLYRDIERWNVTPAVNGRFFDLSAGEIPW